MYRYSICFKEKVVQEVASGASINEVRRRYGIRGGSTIQTWIKAFGREELLSTVVRVQMRDEIDEISRLKTENSRLKIAIADLVISQQRTDHLIASINNYYQIDAKEKFGKDESLEYESEEKKTSKKKGIEKKVKR
jgi:transposase-like protein